jgi:hypothetical protein
VKDAANHPVKHLLFQRTLKSRQISLMNPVTRMGEAQGEFSIVRQKNQALTVKIQAPDSMRILPFPWQEFINRLPPRFIAPGTNTACGLVQCNVKFAPRPNGLAIHGNLVMDRINFAPKLLNNSAVHTHAPGQDDLFRCAP